MFDYEVSHTKAGKTLNNDCVNGHNEALQIFLVFLILCMSPASNQIKKKITNKKKIENRSPFFECIYSGRERTRAWEEKHEKQFTLKDLNSHIYFIYTYILLIIYTQYTQSKAELDFMKGELLEDILYIFTKKNDKTKENKEFFYIQLV